MFLTHFTEKVLHNQLRIENLVTMEFSSVRTV